MQEYDNCISIGDSPIRSRPIPNFDDISERQKSLTGKQNQFDTYSIKKQYSQRLYDSAIDDIPLIYKCVSNIFVYELSDLANTKIGAFKIQKMLKDVDQVRITAEEILNKIRTQCSIFQFPNFQEFDSILSKNEQKKKQSNQNKNLNYNIYPRKTNLISKIKSVDTQTKLKTVKLLKYCKVLNKRLKKYIKMKRKNLSNKLTNICKHCGVTFNSGRELGGHISRLHNGLSEQFKYKSQIYRINQEQRKRRDALKTLKAQILKSTPTKESVSEVCYRERFQTIHKLKSTPYYNQEQ